MIVPNYYNRTDYYRTVVRNTFPEFPILLICKSEYLESVKKIETGIIRATRFARNYEEHGVGAHFFNVIKIRDSLKHLL